MNKLYCLLTLSILIFSPLHSQDEEEDASCLPPNKKVQKLLDEAREASAQEAVLLYKEAMEKDDDNATIYYEFGLYAYKQGLQQYKNNPNPKGGDKSFERAAELFKKSLERCSYFHSDCSYYLGVINYHFGNQKETKYWLTEFVNFDHKDGHRYNRDHDKRLADVKKLLKTFEEQSAIYDNPVPFDPMIVKNVSTSENEYFPMISPDNELMFFTRRVNRSNLDKGITGTNIVEEFTWARRSSMDSEFDSGKPVANPLNDGTFESYGSATLSVDNKEMILCACKDERVKGQLYRNCDLYVTYYERTGEGGNDYVWSELVNLGENINTKDGWEAQPTLSADGNTLYFTALRPTTQDNDIYFSQRQDDGSWGPAQPFIEINTPGKDKSPFFHQDSETFYFVSSVSDKRKGVGGTDIFYIRLQEDGTWSKPKNIGYPINSEEDEIGLFVSADGTEAYFSSRQKGIWNIYSFELYEEARPQKIIIVKGDLKDDDGNPVTDAEVEINYENGETQKVRMNGNDGKYAAIVKAKDPQDVMVSVKKEGHAFDAQMITKEEVEQVADAETTIRFKDMDVQKIKVGKPYTINDILFATASSELSGRSKFIIKEFAEFLEANPTISILIQGHTDNEGNAENNLTLSQERAESVKNYLIKLGIDKSRLKAKGYGQTLPKVPNDTAENKAKNRRTDFVIEKM